MLLVIVACGDDAAPTTGPSIALPGRDGSAGPGDAQATCDTQKDAQNCGVCGNVCASGPRGAAACSGGKCVLDCQPGWGDCNGNPLDGCETDLGSAVDHCGACDRDCRSCGGATCSQSKCDAAHVVSTTNAITLLDVDADHITYATASEVRQIARTDSKDQSVFAVSSTPWLVATKTNVLFIFPGPDSGAGIYATTAGFVGPQIATYARGQNVDTFAFDDTGAYYAAQKTDSPARQLLRCNNCSVATVLSETENRFRPGAIALDATSVFFGSADMIRRVEKTAEGSKTIAVGQSARSMQVDADYIYWINEEGDDVSRLAKTGGDVQKIATGLDEPRWLKLANGRLYVGDAQAVYRMEKDGSARLELVRAPGPIAVDDTCVFVAAGTAVRRVTR
jgi:hypothetical protein